MIRWEYAVLVRTRRPRRAEGGWMVAVTWFGPDGSAQDLTAQSEIALTHLNRAGTRGWELVAVMVENDRQVSRAEVQRYHLKRPLPAA